MEPEKRAREPEEPEKNTDWIKASPEALAAFYHQCNMNQSFRTEFLKNPVGLLEKNGIEVGEVARAKIKKKVEQLKDDFKEDLSEIAIVPEWEEYGHELLENGWGILVKINSKRGAIP